VTGGDREESRAGGDSKPAGEPTPERGDPGGSLRRRTITVLQWLLALGAFWYVIRGVDRAATAAALGDLSAVVVAAVLAVTALEFCARFTMWYVLVNGLVDASLATTARVDLVIKFVNHVVPSKAAGHSVAPLVLRHYTGVDWSEAVGLAGANTGLYAALYGATALSGVAYFGPLTGHLSGGWLLALVFSTGIYVAAGALVLLAGRRIDAAGRLVARLEGVLRRVPRVGDRLAGVAGALPSFTDDSATTVRDLTSRPGVLVPYALGWMGNLVVLPGLRVVLVLGALGGGFSPPALAGVALVAAYSVTVLPLTPGGVGVAEASATAVLVGLGVAPELATVAVLVDRTLGVYLPALLGWIPSVRVDLAEVVTAEP
jgi:uncharacterized protein (TIRG00374 family)